MGAVVVIPKVTLEPNGSNLLDNEGIVIKKSRMASEEDDPTVRDDWRKNVLISNSSLVLDRKNKVTISVESPCVLRVGLTTVDPQKHANFLDENIFEQESGFGTKKEVNELFINDFSFVVYNSRECLFSKTQSPLWLYIIVVYGCPDINIAQEAGTVNMDFLTSNTTAMTSNTASINIREPVACGITYKIRWKMELKKETFAGKMPQHGLLFLRLSTRKTNNSSEEESPSTLVWETGSAIWDKSFNGTIAVRFVQDKNKTKIMHNIMLHSVNTEREDIVDLQIPENKLYLSIEFSSGEISCECNKEGAITQGLGALVFVTTNNEPPEEAKLSRDILELACVEPVRIQYGMDPTQFVIEFRDRLLNSGEAGLKKAMCSQVFNVTQTSFVQVFGPVDVQDYLEGYFTTPQNGGGDCTVHNVENEQGCWLIEFRNHKVARCIWLQEKVMIERHEVHILPFYERLRFATRSSDGKYGKKPEIDGGKLLIDDIDETKFMFVYSRDEQRQNLKLNTDRESIPVSIRWFTPSDFEGDSRKHRLEIECEIPRNRWKGRIRNKIKQFFDDKIIKNEIEVEKHMWELIEGKVKGLQRSTGSSDLILNQDKAVVIITGDNRSDIDRLKRSIIGGDPVTQETQIISIPFEKYTCLREEKLLETVEKECPNVSLSVNNDTKELFISGPVEEVKMAKDRVHKMALNIKNVHVDLTTAQTNFLKTDKGMAFFQECLKENDINQHFSIPPHSEELVVLTYLDDPQNDKKTKKISDILSKRISTVSVSVNQKHFSVIHSHSWESFQSEQEDGFPVTITYNRSTSTVEIIGAKNILPDVKKNVEMYLESDAEGKDSLTVSPLVAEYLETFEHETYQSQCTFCRDTGEYTGKVIISGSVKSVQDCRSKLERNNKEIKVFWAFISKKWIAGAVEYLPVTRLQNLETCLVQADTCDSLATNNIQCVSVYTKSGAVIQAKIGNITNELVDVIVNSSDSNMEFTGGIAAQICEKGGPTVKGDCENQVKINGPFEVSQVISSGPGRLRCLKIVHAVPPKWIDGQSNEPELMKKTVEAILKSVSESNFISVAIPPLGCDTRQYTEDQAVQHIVEAVVAFFEKDTKCSVKEVFLVASNPQIVSKFSEALKNLKHPWNTFCHGRKMPKAVIKTNDSTTGDNTENADVINPLPDSFKWKGKGKRKDKTLRWRLTGSQPLQRLSENDEGTEIMPESFTESACKELPYRIQIASSTTLHVIVGNLARHKMDVIVNVTPKYPDVVGNLTSAVIVDGELQQEWANLKSLEIGEVKCTTAGHGRLRCKSVYHIIAPSRNLRMMSNANAIRDIVNLCLQRANEDQCQSIAFPVIDQGKLTEDKVAAAMVKGVYEFLQAEKKCSIKDVYFVIFHKDFHTKKVFEQEIPNLLKFENEFDDDEPVSRVTMVKRKTPVYVEPTERTAADDIAIFKIVSMTDGEKIRKKIVQMVDREIVTKWFDFKKLSDENKLDQKEETCLKTLENTHSVSLLVDNKTTSIKVTGLKKRVDKCETDIIVMLSKDFPMMRFKRKLENQIAKSVQWFYDDNGQKREHDPASNLALHMGYISNQTKTHFTYYNAHNEAEYTVDVQMQQEYPTSDSNQKRQLYQRFISLAMIAIPDAWSIASSKTNQAQVKLLPSDKEYTDVKAKLLADGLKPTSIVNIIRLENKHMWQMYHAKKEQIDKQNPKGTQNERHLWHGTDPATVDLVIKFGYDRSFCGKNATAYGNGAYFAIQSSYSNGFAVIDGTGVRRMFLNKVLTGIYTNGVNGMNYLPERTKLNGIPLLYDSAANNTGNPSMFIIFHDSQAYPEYLIEYK
ncbi:protein mono-ADP-ribosyltransferase PARP14-like isoform X2 [Mya arenaria]|uniref:protein mono-ADP-ribosyltransferase PARP14-like isoform X2 n=1 Tax=Mya arenaria TaxID=6604 RepID=UPI0022E82CE6|nr:protein mono-ADP-ribosyltransferase PARP14-like isoform X2 [Mya arenaria]